MTTFDESKALGYINHRLYTDVDSYAVLELSKDKKRATVIQVERPLAKCFNQGSAKQNGVPDGLITVGNPFEVKYTYKKWRSVDIPHVIFGTHIDPDCRYYYDLNF